MRMWGKWNPPYIAGGYVKYCNHFEKTSNIYLMHCGVISGREIQKGGDICICMADSLCCTVEINTTL